MVFVDIEIAGYFCEVRGAVIGFGSPVWEVDLPELLVRFGMGELVLLYFGVGVDFCIFLWRFGITLYF